jgi:hypothetical protein
VTGAGAHGDRRNGECSDDEWGGELMAKAHE